MNVQVGTIHKIRIVLYMIFDPDLAVLGWLGTGKRGRRNSVGSLDSTIEVSQPLY